MYSIFVIYDISIQLASHIVYHLNVFHRILRVRLLIYLLFIRTLFCSEVSFGQKYDNIYILYNMRTLF